MSFGPMRANVGPAERRRSYLKLVYENGFHDGIYAGEAVREGAYLLDEEALMRYRIGLRIGKRERARA